MGCAGNAAEQNESAPELEPAGATELPATPMRAFVYASEMLVGYIAPETADIAVRTSLHGFLRTAENLGYPAKLYYADMGAGAVSAVEQAAADGCAGLLIWNKDEKNQSAIQRAIALSLPVVVPYYEAEEQGVNANVVADYMGYAEEVALGVAERMVERECKAGKILVYGSNPLAIYDVFTEAVKNYYPQYNVSYFIKSALTEEAAIEELSLHILENRDIKGLFCMDTDGANIAVRAREKAIKDFKDSSVQSNAKSTPSVKATPTPTPTAGEAPSATPQPITPQVTPIPEGLLKSIIISVAGYGLSDDAVRLMRNNDIYAFVLEPYYEASAQSMLLLDRILRGESVPLRTRLNMPIVRMETLDKYLLIHEQVQKWFS